MSDRQDDLQDKRTIDELRSDYATFESEIAKLYDSITVGRISKPHTHTMHVEQIVSERIEDAYADGEKAATDHIVEALRTAAARHDMTPGEAFILEVAAGRIEDGTI